MQIEILHWNHIRHGCLRNYHLHPGLQLAPPSGFVDWVRGCWCCPSRRGRTGGQGKSCRGKRTLQCLSAITVNQNFRRVTRYYNFECKAFTSPCGMVSWDTYCHTQSDSSSFLCYPLTYSLFVLRPRFLCLRHRTFHQPPSKLQVLRWLKIEKSALMISKYSCFTKLKTYDIIKPEYVYTNL